MSNGVHIGFIGGQKNGGRDGSFGNAGDITKRLTLQECRHLKAGKA
jgi:hypothetical protein